MHLTKADLKNTEDWKRKGFLLPSFDYKKMEESTLQNPVWIHFGAGNIFRSFPAVLMQTLLERGITDKGIIVGEGFDFEIIDRIYKPHDNLSLLVTLKPDGTVGRQVIASVAAAWKCGAEYESEWAAFKTAFKKQSLQLVTCTITEKGYALGRTDGSFFPFIEEDFKSGPEAHLNSMMSKLTALVYQRYLGGKQKLALCSIDNCSRNGEKLEKAVTTVAGKWVGNGFCEQEFLSYLKDDVSFPWSMIDKITPRPAESVQELLKKDDFEDTAITVTGKNTYIAPFVNAEKPQYLVIEDAFPNGRPPLENAGVRFTDRESVTKVERMKVCTCLNPLHTCLAVFGCLLGYTSISEEMKNPVLNKMVHKIGYDEGLPVVTDPGIINPREFLKEVLEERLPNPFIPDTPQRIATDTSQKLAIRFGETIKAYIANAELKPENLRLIPLVFAGWLRYVPGIDDAGNRFTPSSDPLLGTIQAALSGIHPGDTGPFTEVLKPLLQDDSLWGVNLYTAGLADKVIGCFTELMAGPGAVQKTLARYVQ
jgi:fructuronate reductase